MKEKIEIKYLDDEVNEIFWLLSQITLLLASGLKDESTLTESEESEKKFIILNKKLFSKLEVFGSWISNPESRRKAYLIRDYDSMMSDLSSSEEILVALQELEDVETDKLLISKISKTKMIGRTLLDSVYAEIKLAKKK